ncbi:hypothetical protein MLD38_014365 [Melastoma candidum]|uniref:Uncharacterized protein n=1 Tax=Melastoma candidum TaxID=119954 RepID=A0ACB9RGQ3_9MYRT|nr:hypothetical protein MLD38_014365 [Melastoma candidum]
MNAVPLILAAFAFVALIQLSYGQTVTPPLLLLPPPRLITTELRSIKGLLTSCCWWLWPLPTFSTES